MSSVRNPRKLYVSNVSRDARERDVGRLFSDCGRISRIQFKQNFCFVEFEHAHAAEDAIRKFNGIDFMGRRLVVELYVYRGGDPRYRPSVLSGRDRFGSSNGNTGGGSGYRLVVTGLDSMTSWQDLKDFGRTAGKSVSFADVYTRRGSKEGIIEYHDYEDYKHAIRYLDEARLNGVRVRVYDEQKGRDMDRDRDRDRGRDRGRYRSKSRSRSRSRSRDRGRKHRSVSKSKSKSRSRSRGSRSRSGSGGKKIKEEDKGKHGKRGVRRSRSRSRTSRDRSRSKSESGDGGDDGGSVKSDGGSRSPK